MSRMLLFVPGILLTFVVSLDGKHWPDFSCYPHKESALQKRYTNFHGMAYESCKESYENNKGRCDKICHLINMEVLVRTKKKGPFTINVDKFITLLVDELGIDVDNSSSSEKTIMDNVRSAMEDCKLKYPEHATLKTKNTPCEPWSNVTRCIETASGCGVYGNK